jgi:hypothetical protein
VRAIADAELFGRVDATRFKSRNLFEQRGQVDDDAVADHGLDARA